MLDRPRILVVGATGALGRPVVQGLLARGAQVRGLCRHPEAGADLAAAGAEMVTGDLTDRTSLERACAGVHGVLAAAHGLLGRGRWRSEAVDETGHHDLLDAARQAGVRRFVYTSALLATPDSPLDFGRRKHALEVAVEHSGLDWAILRPAAFMEHHVHAFNGAMVLAKGQARLIGPGDKPRNFVAATDVARFAVRALLDEPLPFRRLDIGGPDHASNAEVAALYARLAGRPVKISHLPVAVARVAAAVLKPLHPGIARVMHLMSLPDEAFDEHWDGAAALERAYGERLTRLDAFVRARVAEDRAAQRRA